ncbi:hypothetical protein [Vibrio sp. CAU 1672]|uniref:hypothetical protein n=1 Tax=Vibrio sp. CAU 1672 TaxID=3032594 RepID=UPI0023DCA858|nr:hypothetical protein [Vibrio sp. CAU 1672]MDF2152767.1 hypothetical protein [Vibrio sp. CAU 1672]
MMSLNEIVSEMQFEAIPYVGRHREALQRWVEAQAPLFQKVCENKPGVATTSHLLGLLTKSHIEASAHYSNQAGPAQNMREVLKDTLGSKHADKFSNQAFDDLVVITHLWLYTQGYLNMDFSLAHDHAMQTHATVERELILTQTDIAEFRSALMQSFYWGKQANPVAPKGLLGWLKRYLSS